MREEVEDRSPEGSNRDGVETITITEPYMYRHIKAYIMDKLYKRDEQLAERTYLHGHPQMTIHSCWSGYSEYTITNRWDEIEITWDGHRAYFGNTTAFFRAMAVVDPDDYRWS